jgi:serine/threonine protein kinase/WD40 repeat protein
MNAAEPCPDPGLYDSLLSQGPLPEEQLERLAAHLEGCPHCVATVQKRLGTDTLAEQLATARPVPPGGEEDLVSRLMDRLHRTLSLAGNDSSATQGMAAGPEDVTTFLAPPQQAGEVGRLAHFRVFDVIGCGGMGVVLRAEDSQLGRAVALKVMRPALTANSDARRRFTSEARAMAAVEHDHIAPVYHVGEERGVPFLAMPLLRGESLETRLGREGRLSTAQAVRIGREIALGLAAAHKRGLIHRDIKPANIWLEEHGQETVPQHGGRVKILDFGLARAAGDTSHITQSGAIVGTPAYMAPEQGRGEKVDHRSDLFSLGVVLYRLCTGRLPFAGTSAMAVLTSLALDTPPGPHQVNGEVPTGLSDFVMRLLEKDPQKRPVSAQEVAQALAQPESQATMVLEPATRGRDSAPRVTQTTVGPTAAPARSRRWIVAAAAIVVLIGGGLLAQQLILCIQDREGKVKQEIALEPADRIEIGQKPAAVKMPSTANPLDQLDPAKIPASERFPWQPKELVAVFGTHAWHHGGDYNWHVGPTLAFTDKGRLIAMTSNGHARGSVHERHGDTIYINDVTTGQDLARFSLIGGHQAAFAPNGKYVALVRGDDADWTWKVWEVAGQKEIATIRSTGTVPPLLAISPDGKLLATAGQNHGLRVWNANTQQSIAHWDVWCGQVVFAANGEPLLADTYQRRDGTWITTVWDVSKEKEVASVQHPENIQVVSALAFSADARTLAISGQTKKTQHFLRGWDVVTAKAWDHELSEFDNQSPGALAFSPDSRTLVFSGGFPYGNSVKLFDAATGKDTLTLAEKDTVCSLAFSPDGSQVAGANRDGFITVWNTTTGERLNPQTPPASLLALSPDGRTMAMGQDFRPRVFEHRSYPTTLALIDGMTGRERQFFDMPPSNRIVAAEFSPDGKTLAIAVAMGSSAGNYTALLDVATGEKRATLSAKNVRHLTYSPDGKTLALWGSFANHEGGLWDTATRKRRESLKFGDLKGSRGPGAFSPDNSMLAVGTQMGLRFFDAATGEELFTLPTGDMIPDRETLALRHAYAFSQDGNSILFRDIPKNGNVVHLWDLRNRKEIATYKDGHTSLITGVAFGPDGKTVISAGADGRIIRWTSPTEKQVWQLPFMIDRIALSSDRRYLFTANHNGTTYVFRLAPPGEVVVPEANGPLAQPPMVADRLPPQVTNQQFTNQLGMEFVLVPKGKSWLGGGSGKVGEQEVEISHDFYLGKFEVTQEEWQKVMGQNPSHFKAVAGIKPEDQKRLPVELVSWDDAQEFIKRVNGLAKETGWVYRLPTEAEWEYACRGGPLSDRPQSAFDFYFAEPTNTLLPAQANFAPGLGRTCKVGSFPPNRLGLHDMHGNVIEWTHDSEKLGDGTVHHRLRGGGWQHTPQQCRAAFRYPRPPSFQHDSLGLRLARVPIGK